MSLPRYESYKDSGVEWLGEVPEHWGIVRLRYLCKIETGDADTVDSNEDGSYPFFVRSPNIEKINRYTHDCEAILTAGDGVGVGKVFHYFDGKFCAHQRVYIFRQFEGVQGKFFFHYLKELFLRVVLEGTAKSTVDSLRRPMIADFLMTVPYIEEQSIIADFLDQETAKIDNLIAEQQQLIELLKEKRQAVISHAVTKGLNPDVTMKDSGVEWLGEVPEHWNIVKLKQIASIQNGRDYKHIETEFNGYPVIGSGGTFTRASEFIYSGESVLLGRKGTINKPLYINESFWVVDTMFYTKINPQYSAKYLYYCSLTIHFDYYSTSTALPSMTQESLGNIFFAISSLDEQQKIAQFLDQETAKIDNLIAESTNLISLSKERRSALISSAVTGKIDVRNYVPSQPNVEAMT